MRKLLPFFLFFFTLITFSQKEANFWYFGRNAALDFNSGKPVPVSGSLLNTTEGCSSFSDVDGNLLFYVGAPSPSTNNLTVWNKNNVPMTRGIGIQGDASSSQSALTIPAPGRPNIYYLFTVGAPSSGNQGFWYYTIDMDRNGGLGDVDSGPRDLADGLDSFWTEKVTAVKADECNAFWVISVTGETFYAYKVNDAGVDYNNPVKSNVFNFTNNDARGYLKVSPDGKNIVSANMNAGTYLLDFDDKTGIVSNSRQLDLIGNGYGVEFSRTSSRVYISTGQFSNSVENLYQFDLSLPTIAEINTSRFLVHSYNNTRGALQLGPDGKIYWTSDGSENISVINSPDRLGPNCDYSHRTVSITTPGSGVTATQGLPPFISSLLLPVDIREASSGNVVNNETLSLCTGDSKTITSANITGTDITYEWTLLRGVNTTTVSNDPNLQLDNLDFDDEGNYTLTIKLTDDCGNVTQYQASFDIEVNQAVTANKPNNINFCDFDDDGFNEFNLETLVTPQILDTQVPRTVEVFYYKSLADATSNTSPISNLYTNPSAFSKEVIYSRIHNVKAPNACFDITSFELNINSVPVALNPINYLACDNTSVGNDTDGFVNDFILSTKDSEVLGILDPAQFNVSYHTTLNGAETSSSTDVINKAINYTNATANTQTIYVRVENVDNVVCADTSKSFNLIVSPLPTVTAITELKQCDTDPDKQTTFNLTESEINITSDANITFEYFENEANAITGTPEVADKTAYFVDTTGEAWVRAVSEFGCYRISKIELTVSFTPNEPYEETFTSCDDFLDADGNNTATNSDTDGITFFDFSIAPSQITNDPDIVIEFYETEDDRTRSLNEIQASQSINNYRNQNIPNTTGVRFPIFYKLTSKTNNDCQGLGQIYLRVDPVPTAQIVTNLELCDNIIDGSATNGIVQNFNLESQTIGILGAQNPANFTVTYHISANDANTGNSPQTSPFTNTVRDSQTIYVRITNNTTGCFTDHTTFNAIVNPIPTANFVSDLQVCDDNSDGSARNGFSQSINLESQTATILGTQDPSVYNVTYHRSLAEAQSGASPLASPYSNLTANRETIYIRIYNTNTMCANDISQFDVIINPEPTFDVISNLSYCDNDLDGDDTNGVIQNIDLDSQIATILGAAQDPDDYIVTFHSNQTDATSGASPIASPYTNTNMTETIFVRIQNKATSCVNSDFTFDVIVNPLPDFNVTTPQILCLNDLPLNVSAENPNDVYTYEWKNENGDIISTNNNADITAKGNYTATATTTNGTNCSRTRAFVINESNPATLENSFITIIDESNNISSKNDLSISIDVINNDLGPGDYHFSLETEQGIVVRGFQDEPLFENLEGGIYKIVVNDKNGCSPDTTLLVSVIEFPKFFTPNSDGKNDTWVIKGANKDFYPSSSINIFNRFGKLVAQLPIDGQGWNGTYQGKVLPSDDYWFNIILTPADTNKQTINKKGHFSLLRR